MNGIHVGDFFPELFEQAIGFREVIAPIALLLVTAGIIMRGLQGLHGDMRALWSGIVTATVIAILIPTFPEIVNNMQLATHSLVEQTGANPSETSEKFGNLIVGQTADQESEVGFMDILFDNKGGFGKAMLYVVLMLVSFLALVIQYIYFVIQQFLIIYGIALSPLFLSFFMLDSLKGIAVKYFLGIAVFTLWPLGWGIADLLTDSLLQRAADAGVYETGALGFISTSSQSFFFAVVIAVWLLLSTIGSPLVMTKIVTEGANAGSAIFQRVGAAIGQGASYGIVAGGTARLSGASRTRTALATFGASGGGAISGAAGTSASLLTTVIGLSAAKSGIGAINGKDSGESTDYNAKAAKIANKNKS